MCQIESVKMLLLIFLPPAKEVWGKVIFLDANVKNSVHRGVCLSACWDTTPPREQVPPGPGTPGPGTPRPGTPQTMHPPDQISPGPGTTPAQSMLGDTVNEQAVRILLECNLVPSCVDNIHSI